MPPVENELCAQTIENIFFVKITEAAIISAKKVT